MGAAPGQYRFLLLQAFSLPAGSKYTLRPMSGAKEAMLMNHGDFASVLEGVSWDLHPGAPAPHGDWPVETREEFCLLSASRLPIVREACESGKYNAIVMLGGGDPGFPEAREIGRRHGIPVTSNAHAQMHLAAVFGLDDLLGHLHQAASLDHRLVDAAEVLGGLLRKEMVVVFPERLLRPYCSDLLLLLVPEDEAEVIRGVLRENRHREVVEDRFDDAEFLHDSALEP